MWCNSELVVLEYNIFGFRSARCIRIWSAQRFFLCRCHILFVSSHVHKCFCVSGLGILARARGNFMHNNILRHTFYTVCLKVGRYVKFVTSRHV